MKVILSDTTVKKVINLLGHHKYNMNSMREIVESSVLIGELKGALGLATLMQKDAKDLDNDIAEYMCKRIDEVVNKRE